MRLTKATLLNTCLAAAAGFALTLADASAAPLPPGWSTNPGGNAGTLGPDGVVTSPPAFGPGYLYISTVGTPNDGPSGPASLGIGSETNGTLLISPTFGAGVGDRLSFYFNYVTSDGAEYIEYAWAKLVGGPADVILFTARTTPSGDTVPGAGLPGLAPGVTLTPASTPIIPGGPLWSPLGGDSGACYDAGCGYTGWIEMEYTITTAATYTLQFGVVNWLDTDYDTGMAIAGAAINDNPIGVPVPAALTLFGFGLLGIGVVAKRRKSA
jgi:hypothetical protein